MKILALDLGLGRTTACVLDTDSNQHRFSSIATSPEAIAALLTQARPDRVVFEVCTIAGWVHDLCAEHCVDIEVANPSHEAWRWKSVKRKTDRDDALKLARLSAMAQLPKVHVPSGETRQWRSLIGYRQKLVQRRTRIKNHLRALLHAHSQRLPTAARAWTVVMLDELGRIASSAGGELWRAELRIELEQLRDVERAIESVERELDARAAEQPAVKLVRTIPGVGPRLAETMVAMIDDPHRFASGRQVGSYAGLTPTQFQSGNTDRRGRISRQGNPLLRSLLVEVCWLGRRYNPVIAAVYERVRGSSPTRKKIAIVAVARRLLVWAWAMLRDESPWDPSRYGSVPMA